MLHSRRRLKFISWALAIVILYAPFGWLLFVNDDAAYIRYWITRWPVLPGLAPTFLILIPFNMPPGQLPAPLDLVIMGFISLAALLAFVWLASRSRRRLVITAVIAAALSALNGWIAHAIFAA